MLSEQRRDEEIRLDHTTAKDTFMTALKTTKDMEELSDRIKERIND